MAGQMLIMIGFAFLLIQGVSELIKRIAVMRDLILTHMRAKKLT